MPPYLGQGPDVVLGSGSRQPPEPAQRCQHRKAKGLGAGEKVLRVSELDAVDPGRRLAAGTRYEARQIEDDHPAPRSAVTEALPQRAHIIPHAVL